MTLFDFIAILILAVSGIVGFVRGATREVMTVLAFILAVLISIFALRFTGPIPVCGASRLSDAVRRIGDGLWD